MIRYKKLSKNRALTIPKDAAAHIGVSGGEALELIIHADSILVKKRPPVSVSAPTQSPQKLTKV